MLRTCIAVGSILALFTVACGGKNGGNNDDASTRPIDGPVRGVDGSNAAVDASVNVPDGAVADCTPTSGTTAKRTLVDYFVNPVFATAPAGDPRLFVVERAGRIRIVKNGSTLATPFLDITSMVRSSPYNEQGLLGLAFHPNFATNGRFFILYSQAGSGEGRPNIVAEYHATPTSDTADPNAVATILTVEEPAWNHNGGMLAFGPDDYLYVGLGDGGGGGDTYGNGQNLNSLLGAILRIDINSGSPYSVPSTNPFVGQSGLDEIWAYGLRNPWRFSFDGITGDLYIGDVGQNNREEIDVQPSTSAGGENYGWPLCEGNRNYDGSCAKSNLTAPVATQLRQDACSITGGYVYRGTCMPDLQGWYFYGDHCSGKAWRFQYSGGSAQNEVDISNEIGGMAISSFGQDGTGELYVVDHQNGGVYRLELAP